MNTKVLSRHLGRFGCLALAAFGATPFAAKADSSSDQAVTLQEIIVTAQKRDENIDKVPISIMALSQRTMDDLKIENIADVVSVVPGLQIQPVATNFQDSSNISIRGISLAGGQAPTTQLYIDETPIAIRELGNAFSKSPYPLIFDLDRVEVLRGPQGTLFGASAMGGAIRFITPQPNLHDGSGVVKADFGYTDGGDPSYEVGGAYGAPIVSGVLGFRVSAWYQSLGGWIDQVDPWTGTTLEKNANRSNAYVIRPAVTWAPSDALAITASAFLQHQYSQNPDSYWVNRNLPLPENGQVWGGALQPATDDLRVGSLSIKYNFAGLSFVSDTSYLDRTTSTIEDVTQLFNYEYTGIPGMAFNPALKSFVQLNDNNSSTYAWQQEFRLSSQAPDARVNWLVGAYFRSARQDLQQLETPDLSPLFEAAFDGATSLQVTGNPDYIYNGQVLNAYSDYHATDTSEALFGNLWVNLLARLRLELGVRAEHLVVKDQTQFIAGPAWFLPPGVESNFQALPDAIANPITPRASLNYQVTDLDMIYLSVAKGFRAGAGNTLAGLAANSNPRCQQVLHELGLSEVPAAYGPDHVWTYELGAKGLLLDRRLSIQASAFYTKWTDIQTPIALPGCPVDSSFTGNEGEAISQGFDLQLAAAITTDLTFGGQVGYVNTYYPDAAYSVPNAHGAVLLHGAGDKLGAIPWTAAANAQYSHEISPLWSSARAYIRLDYRWTDTYPSPDPRIFGYDPTLLPYKQPAYDVLNVRVGVTHEGLDLSAYVNNATHSNPLLHYGDLFQGNPLFTAGMLRPITVGLTGFYRF